MTPLSVATKTPIVETSDNKDVSKDMKKPIVATSNVRDISQVSDSPVPDIKNNVFIQQEVNELPTTDHSKPVNKAKVRNKRKAKEDSDYEEETNNVEKEEARKVKKPRRKRVKVDVEEKDSENVENEECGPSDINMFALGFEGKGVDTVNTKKMSTKQERLEMKLKTGKANDMFVKIDLKKKKFSKGKFSGARLLRAEAKRKLDIKEGRKVKEWKCYNCGEAGHLAWQCTGGRGDSLIPTDMADEFDAGEFPSLQQVSKWYPIIVK